MKRKKINRLIFIASLTIVAILTACPPHNSGPDSGGVNSKSVPTFKSLGIDIDENKIIVFFNTDISGTPDASKISLKKGSATLTPTTDYTLTIEQGSLVIKLLKIILRAGNKYTVELQGGAVKNAKGKDSIASTPSSFTLNDIPALVGGSLSFRASALGKILGLSLNNDMEIVDASKIKVEVQVDGKGKFTTVSASSKVNTVNKTSLELTLSTPAKADNVYRVRVGAGAIRTTVSKLTNIRELTSSEAIHSGSPPTPSLDRHNLPYILNNKLVATFNFPIAIKNQENVKVYKNPARDSDGKEVPLEQNSIAVNNVNKRLLEITLPEDVVEDEVYRLKLDAGAVNKEDKKTNVNKAISPKDLDIRIKAAPVLAERMPFFGRQKIIVTFDGPISILEPNKIKYQLDSTTITPTTTPTVENNNQLEIPLNDLPDAGQVYRIHLEAGALGGDKNQPSTGNIQPNDKDITAVEPTLTDVQPAFDSTKQLSVTFPVDVAIVGDGSTINVQKKDDEDDTTTSVDESDFRTVSSRDIQIDIENLAKINIILTGSEEVTPYTQVWKVEFPRDTVESTSGIGNSIKLTTDESNKPRLTDLYSWEQVPAEDSKWTARWGHASVVFNPGDGEKIWVLGGQDNKEVFNDVWSSPDGSNWTKSTPPGKKITTGENKNWWTARWGHTSVVFDGKIWVMGGEAGKYANDVWSSADGQTWTESTPPNDADGNTVVKNNKNWWSVRHSHTSVVFDGKIWVMGGRDLNRRFNDVWSSTDGSTWVKERAGTNTGWEARSGHASAVFKDKIWLIEATNLLEANRNVWHSTNGQGWEKGTDLPNRGLNYKMVKYKDRLWSIGGGHSDRKSFWSNSAPDTGDWIVENALSSEIHHTGAVVFKNSIWLLGGEYGGAITDKVWKMGPALE